MKEVLDILRELHPEVDFETETGLIEKGILDSFDVVTVAAEIDGRLGVALPAEELLPENFDSAQAIWALIRRLQG